MTRVTSGDSSGPRVASSCAEREVALVLSLGVSYDAWGVRGPWLYPPFLIRGSVQKRQGGSLL